MRTTIVSDKDLVATYLGGDSDALRILFNRHRDKIFTSIVILVKDRAVAEDVFQDTFVKVIDTLNLGKYREEGKFLPWSMRIAHNLCIDYFRKGKKMPKVTVDDDKDVFSFINILEETVEDEMIKNQSHSKLRVLIQHLPEEQREVLVLRHYSGLSFKEIAEQTGVSINTALGRMRYALNNLRKMVKQNNIVL